MSVIYKINVKSSERSWWWLRQCRRLFFFSCIIFFSSSYYSFFFCECLCSCHLLFIQAISNILDVSFLVSIHTYKGVYWSYFDGIEHSNHSNTDKNVFLKVLTTKNEENRVTLFLCLLFVNIFLVVVDIWCVFVLYPLRSGGYTAWLIANTERHLLIILRSFFFVIWMTFRSTYLVLKGFNLHILLRFSLSLSQNVTISVNHAFLNTFYSHGC